MLNFISKYFLRQGKKSVFNLLCMSKVASAVLQIANPL